MLDSIGNTTSLLINSKSVSIDLIRAVVLEQGFCFKQSYNVTVSASGESPKLEYTCHN